ncbi:cutinase family protein [Nocardia huaxiensis]|uniref:cutinase family protein n=1 Tax=Nocardia huaxiensis TaxID=2755382 RepID=UPI001E356508|nr:cutinase family protein [Nocardia huaxiensis]UFS98918.1 cutinase family protein [Nocardia huaxiensis]
MSNRRVLLPGNRPVFERLRTAWIFAVMAMVATSLFFPLRQPVAHADWCADIDVVVARGTGESGWLGDAVGNPLYGMLQDRLPASTTAYPVNYPADYSFNLGAGSADLVGHLASQADACPGQRFVLVGYSQGAAAIHAALGTGAVAWVAGRVQLPGDLGDRVAAVLLFGDPMRAIGWNVPDAYLWRTGNYCAGGDPVCGGGANAASHVAYGDSFVAAANFAADRI